MKIVTKMDWPSFKNVALQISQVLNKHCRCVVYDRSDAEPGGNTLFIGTVHHQTLKLVAKLVKRSRIVFYGTTEGHSFVDKPSRKIAEQIKIVAVSGFAKQMLEEIGIPVSGVVHHGLDMTSRSCEIDRQFYEFLRRKFRDKRVIFAALANHSRKGLDNLLRSFHLVEKEIDDAYLILHSEPVGYYNTGKIAKNLRIKRLWLTNLYGKLSYSRLNAFYKLCSFYVQPSYSEGFGLPILEAFRFDKPVISVDAQPFNEIIRQRENGILVPWSRTEWFNFDNLVLFKMHLYRAEDFANAMLELLSNQQLVRAMQENIRKEKHSWSTNKLYPRLLDFFAQA